MRVVVTGGRNFQDGSFVWKTLDGLGVTELAEGGATGADRLARLWAMKRGVPNRVYAAAWRLYGVSAGPRRNRLMLRNFKPDALVAFPGGHGTANCVAEARRLGINVVEVKA